MVDTVLALLAQRDLNTYESCGGDDGRPKTPAPMMRMDSGTDCDSLGREMDVLGVDMLSI